MPFRNLLNSFGNSIIIDFQWLYISFLFLIALYLPNQILLKLIFRMLFLIHVLLYKTTCQWVIQSSFLHLTVSLMVYSGSRFFLFFCFYFVLIPNQIKVWDGFQTDFSSFIIKPAFCREFFTNSNGVKSFYMNLQLLNRHQESKLF